MTADDAGTEKVALDLAALVALEEPARDGRVARGQRTRRSVAEALTDLLRAGDPDPTAKEVARRAGVSLRLVFHHFADMDDLYQFVGTLQLRRQWADMPQLSPRLSLSTRIERTVAHRAALFEETTQVRRALMCRAPTSGAVRQALAASDNLLLEDLKATFAGELADLPATSRSEYLGAMDTGTSWEVWERLRTTSSVPVRSARRVMSLMLEALFAGVEDGGRRGATMTAS
jgi:TetR/AcrR family transcriptional regulator, regulator of autoinduction and epiphytic fitness